MTGWVLTALVSGMVTATMPGDSLSAAATPVEARHDFHVSYTRMAIEASEISAQIRLFTDDVTRALIERSKKPSITLNSPDGDKAFAAYLADAFVVTANGRRLTPTVVNSTTDKDMTAYIVTWTSAAPITSLSMHNAALFELFDDQQNIVKVKHMVSGKESTLFYAGGSRADQVVRF